MGEKVDMGMAHLLGQAGKKTGFDATVCQKITVPVNGAEYYLAMPDEGGAFAPSEIGMKAADAYSEIRDLQSGKITAIKKHPLMTFIGTGLIHEVVKKPSWWTNRDNGTI